MQDVGKYYRLQSHDQGLNVLVPKLFLSSKNSIEKYIFESVLMRWMKLEPIIQSEVSQKDKDHYCILIHIYGI